jgi:hypothetical protein
MKKLIEKIEQELYHQIQSGNVDLEEGYSYYEKELEVLEDIYNIGFWCQYEYEQSSYEYEASEKIEIDITSIGLEYSGIERIIYDADGLFETINQSLKN